MKDIERIFTDVRPEPVADHAARLRLQSERAAKLHHDRKCPHCEQPLSMQDVLFMANGNRHVFYVKFIQPTGDMYVVRSGAFWPHSMLWLDEQPA